MENPWGVMSVGRDLSDEESAIKMIDHLKLEIEKEKLKSC